MTDIDELSVASASELIGRGELSPLELTEHCLARIEGLDDTIRAFLSVDAPGAVERARALSEDKAHRSASGHLYGIPFGIKDIIDVAGLPTTASSRVLEGNVAGKDAPVVGMLRDAGTVLLGKTNTQEFAYGVVTAPTSNPWDPDRIPGGSSGGSAAAVASGMATAALGTDTAGSIRIPSALCGTSGLMPRRGALPMEGIIPLAPSLDRCGPIARDALDLGLIWGALTGGPTTAPSDPGGLRVGAPAAPSDIGEMDAEVEEAVEGALGAFEEIGAQRVTINLPHLKEWDYPRAVPLMVEALKVHTDAGWFPSRAEDYEPSTVDAHRFAAKLPADALDAAYGQLEPLKARFMSAFDSADVLILPTTPVPAPTKAEAAARDDAHRPPVTRTLTRICGPVNYCELAAVSIPCGFTAEGLPIGLQIIGRTERSVLGAALLYQSATEWHTRRPELLAEPTSG
jgi:aspartyl-tRNA(Asn)/glutamyl-tRNA(Gln) amidotransferase subunit A